MEWMTLLQAFHGDITMMRMLISKVRVGQRERERERLYQ